MVSTFDIDSVLKSLTFEEKVSILAGASFTETKGIVSKGVPNIKALDGPNGVRSAATDADIHSACFPAACCLAATFDPDLAKRIGRALAIEARGKNAHCILGPTVCIHRHPLGGRNFESFSEDPLLAGKLAASYIQGLQDLGVSATIKHFVANEQETNRMTVDEKISDRALREIYLKPFEIAVREAVPWAIMTAYNQINGTHCDNNEWLIKQVLRGEWGWEGLVMSDWGGTNSVAAALKAGLDLEMPGPPKIRKLPAVMTALTKGDISEDDIDDRVRAVLKFVYKLRALEASIDPTMLGAMTDKPELRKLIREAAARGMVLLKNESSILPLAPEKVKGMKIAMIGFAKDALAHGGGSAAVNSYYKVTPWDGIRAALGEDVEFTFAAGAHRERLLPSINMDGSCGTVFGTNGQPGFTCVLSRDTDNEAVKTSHGHSLSAYSPLGSQESLWKVLEIIGDFTPLESGHHYIACSGLGPTRVYFDDELVFEQKFNSSDPMGSLFLAAPEHEFQRFLSAKKKYRVRIRSEPPLHLGLEILEGRSGVRMGFSLESVHDADLVGEAVRVAKEADIAIAFTGHDPSWETEGRDQDSFDLPRRQNELISAVATANKNTIVINSTGVAVSMPWLDNVAGIIQAWFPGQECGNAMADVLTGAINPEGRLPMTFPKRIEDAPAYRNFPGEYVDGKLKVTYAEGVFLGYRHFDRCDRDKINFAFGHGLSYSTFEFGAMGLVKQSRSSDLYTVNLDVANTGSLLGGTLVQMYVGRSQRCLDHPVKMLVAFQKVRLQAGDSATVTLSISARDFAYFDEILQQWVVDNGDYVFSLCSSAANVLQTRTVSLERMSWKP